MPRGAETEMTNRDHLFWLTLTNWNGLDDAFALLTCRDAADTQDRRLTFQPCLADRGDDGSRLASCLGGGDKFYDGSARPYTTYLVSTLNSRSKEENEIHEG